MSLDPVLIPNLVPLPHPEELIFPHDNKCFSLIESSWLLVSRGSGLALNLHSPLHPTMHASDPTSSTLRAKLNPVPSDSLLFGRSVPMNELRVRAEKLCRTNIPILLCGEGGTGKEALARWIHQQSEYRSGEFVKVNCAAICGPLLESELFGHEKGAFTGAVEAKPGSVELAHRGTLFLDEITGLDLGSQSKLLHFLQDGTFSRLGDECERKIDARVICTTNGDLEQEMIAGRFREDLFYRIQGFRLRMPALRERREDIPALAQFFQQHFEMQFAMPSPPFPPGMMDDLQNLRWRGNIRELSNHIARYVLIGLEASSAQEEIRRERLAQKIRAKSSTEVVPLKRVAKEAIKEIERNVILDALRANQWNRRRTALDLKISYRALIYKLREAGIVSQRATRAEGGSPSSSQSVTKQ